MSSYFFGVWAAFAWRYGTPILRIAKFGILSAGSSQVCFCREDSTRRVISPSPDAYNLTPAFILETVGAAKGFIEKQPIKNAHNVMGKGHGRGSGPVIAAFLDWPVMRVETALAQLHAIDEGKLSKQAVEELPTIHERKSPSVTLPTERTVKIGFT